MIHLARGTNARAAVPAIDWLGWIGSAVAIFHNHPDGQAWPSPLDQAQQIATGIPWGIAPRGGEAFWVGAPSPLFARPFRWGVTDCYGFVRDARRELFGAEMANYSRCHLEHAAGASIFEKHVAREGFEPVERGVQGAEPGDVVLFGAPVAAHCGVVLGDGQAWHHPSPGVPFSPTHRPRGVPLERIQRLAVRVFRHA